MTVLTKETKEFFTSTLTEAEEKLEELVEQHSTRITKKAIETKEKKGEEYFIVRVTITHDTIKNLTFAYGEE